MKAHELGKNIRFIFDQIPMPPRENALYATDFRTGRRFASKELVEYKERIQHWGLKRFEKLAKLRESLRWEMADHRKMIVIDAYLFFQYQELFTKPVKKSERPRRKKMDVSGKGKALYDALSVILDVDDSRFRPGKMEPFLRRGEGQYVTVDMRIEMIRDEDEYLFEKQSCSELIY